MQPGADAAAARMVETQIAARGVTDPRVLAAMREVPRDAFVPEGERAAAFDDGPLPIGEGQTISQPYIVALMCEAAEIGPDDRVLDVGTGSGYGSAVASRLAATVCSIERHARLAEAARERLGGLGYGNVEVRVGDGTLGWPEGDAAFDAIIVAAAAPAVPEALKAQLAVGGRLVIPVGARHGQSLVRVRRTEAGDFAEEHLGEVAFVPLVGDQGWPAGKVGERRREPASLPELIRASAEPLPDIDDPAFAALADRVAGAEVVLIGEATHGTSEFYRARAALTRRLVEAHGFTVVAAEADWPDAARIDRHVRGRGDGPAAGEPAFARFPTWMWRNAEVAAFVGWLRDRNAAVADPARRAGFYGLDLYSLSASSRAVLDLLEREDPELARLARERYACIMPWHRDPTAYGRASTQPGFQACEEKVVAMLRDLLAARLDGIGDDPDAGLDAAMNAKVVADAERYYRAMYRGAAESWNLRDTHMYETLRCVLEARGPGAKAVVWAHNSHVGDAAATDMGWRRGELNVGQLCRQAFGGRAALVGFGTDRGTVAAANDWDEPVRIMDVRPSRPDSVERQCLEAGPPAFLLDLREGRAPPVLRARLAEPRLERAIGVVYRPETERWSHYFEADLPGQFDLYLWFEVTRAVTPLPAAAHVEGSAETFPFGV